MIKYLKNWENYKISDFKRMSHNEIRPIFEKVCDFNQNIKPMDVEHESEKKKSPEKSPEKMKSAEKMEEEDVATQKEMKEVSKETGAKRKKSIPRKSTRKRQKMEEDAEKEELKGFLDIIPREEVPIEVLSEMLEDFDRQDVEELYMLVKEKYSASRLEGIHILLMENGLAIHMLTEKKYPLSQELLSKMLSKNLEVDHESSQVFELLRRNGAKRERKKSKDHLADGHTRRSSSEIPQMTDAKDSQYPTQMEFTKDMRDSKVLLGQLEIHGAAVSTEDANQRHFGRECRTEGRRIEGEMDGIRIMYNYAFMANDTSGSGDTQENPHRTLKNKGIIDSGCSRVHDWNKLTLLTIKSLFGGLLPLEVVSGYIMGKGILTKKMNLLKTVLKFLTGIRILPQTPLLQNQMKREEVQERKKEVLSVDLEDFKGQ
ncbi:hypothetical protein Tco_0793161 [Tanacetum coccineum]